MSYLTWIKTFVRIYELGSMSAAARDLRVSAAVASSRISDLEHHLKVRLFNRSTRSLTPTEQGNLFYDGAVKILEAVDQAEGAIAQSNACPRGSLFVAAPLVTGKRLVAPAVPLFKDQYPDVDVRLRLTDRKLDVLAEGLDLAIVFGPLSDSNLRMTTIADCPRLLCAAPRYIQRRGMPNDGEALTRDKHDCLLLRFPGAQEFQWRLQTDKGIRRFDVSGPFESDDGDVLTAWALEGRGIVNKPVMEIAEHLASGALVPVASQTPPPPASLLCLYPHKRLKDYKVQLFIDFITRHCRRALASMPQDPLSYQEPLS